MSHPNDTCVVFKAYSAERKSDFVTKNKLCRMCSQKMNSPGHKRPCIHSERFKCKTCLSPVENERALTHHTELHRAAKKQAPVNSQQVKQPAAPVVPCAAPPGAVPVSVAQPMRPVWNYSTPSWPAMQSQQMSASYFNHPPPLQTMQQPMLPIMQQPVQQPNSSQPIPHHI